MDTIAYLVLSFVLLILSPAYAQLARGTRPTASALADPPATRWSGIKAAKWYQGHAWLIGTNFTPSSASNQLEMWQSATFDPATIDRELGYAEGIGLNAMRVFLHSLVWKEDAAGLKKRMREYLTIADKHHIQTIFVFFDDCWDKNPLPGPQLAPKPGIHNSRWVQDPGDPASRDSTKFMSLKPYVTDILSSFAHDNRVLMWDLYNEPGGTGKGNDSLPLLRNVFAWARAISPEQPLTSGLWSWELMALNTFQATHSDIITYHSYDDPATQQRLIELLATHGRPLICTEYMARPRNSRFVNTLPLFKKYNVGAISWGFVEGKTNTKYAWDTPLPDGSEPSEWFHDVFHQDGTPYHQDEINLIKTYTKRLP